MSARATRRSRQIRGPPWIRCRHIETEVNRHRPDQHIWSSRSRIRPEPPHSTGHATRSTRESSTPNRLVVHDPAARPKQGMRAHEFMGRRTRIHAGVMQTRSSTCTNSPTRHKAAQASWKWARSAQASATGLSGGARRAGRARRMPLRRVPKAIKRQRIRAKSH